MYCRKTGSGHVPLFFGTRGLKVVGSMKYGFFFNFAQGALAYLILLIIFGGGELADAHCAIFLSIYCRKNNQWSCATVLCTCIVGKLAVVMYRCFLVQEH